MQISTEAFHQQRGGSSCRTTTHSPSRGAIVIDSKGIIRSCSDELAQLAGLYDAAVIGQSVRAYIPELPFRPETEEYNVAFSMFMAGQCDPQCWSFITAEGNALQMSGRVSLLKLRSDFAICLDLVYAGVSAPIALNSSDHRYKGGIHAAMGAVPQSLCKRPKVGPEVWLPTRA